MPEQKRILIVDDDHEMANALRRILMIENKYTIEVAYDGFSAGKKFVEFRPDLILLDLRMPGMDGYEVCLNLRKDPAFGHLKVIVVSGALDMDSVERFMKAGANDYLTKPFRSEFLVLKVSRLLE